jgi:hypothetical protein
MRKASTELLEQGIQAPSPAPDLIPAKPKNQPRNHIAIGTANGGTSLPQVNTFERPHMPFFVNLHSTVVIVVISYCECVS